MRLLILLMLLPTLSYSKTITIGEQRFKIVHLQDGRQDRYLLDTKEGRVWRSYCEKFSENGDECEQRVWMPEEVIGVTISKKQYSKRSK